MKMPISIITILLCIACFPSWAADCKCTKRPFVPNPPCYAKCVTGFLAIATEEDLVQYFGLSKEVADAVLEAQPRVISLDQDFLALLSVEQRLAVSHAFDSVSEDRLYKFVALKAENADRGEPFLRELVASSLKESSITAQEALRRAQLAGKLAEGKFLYETDLTEEKVKFGFNTSDLSPEARAAIDEFMAKLNKDQNTVVYVEIQGFTDAAGPQDYNQQLGRRRAEAVSQYITRRHRFPLEKIGIVTYGESVPIADNSTPEGRSENRQVAIVVVQEKS